MNYSPRPQASPENFSRSVLRPIDRRVYEGQGTIPQPADKSELFERFRQKFLPEVAPIGVPERFTSLELGAPAEPLPVRAFKEQIEQSVASHQVTIVTAETGAGKSTQIPQYLLEAGYHVSMTQPRRISASFIAEQIGHELEAVLGEGAKELAGYHTAAHNTTTEKTRVSVVTDGLRLVQEYGEREELEHEVLIIDEVHEWNSNIEILIARVKKMLAEKPDLRVVIMSATMQAEKLARFFEASDMIESVPIIEIPGRNHDVERIDEPGSNAVDQAVKFAKQGENILIFLPGVREIEDTMAGIQTKLRKEGVNDAVILPLHSKLTEAQQDAVKRSYPGPKIICATNIAQTSITIPDVNVVIDTGLERRVEIDEEGVQSLNLRPVSRADMDQRAGRTGRVAPGIYVLTPLSDDHEFIAYHSNERDDYPVPEILRTDVDRNTLLAASAGLDFADLELFHPVQKRTIERAKHNLRMIEAIDEDGAVTHKGLRMSKLPMRPMYARMVIEAEDLGYKAEVRQYVAAMVASLEVGGMPSWLQDAGKEWKRLSEDRSSDMLRDLDIFIRAQQMSVREQHEYSLDVRNVERANELYRRVCRRMNIPYDGQLAVPNEDDREQLRRVIATGMIDFVYKRSGVREYVRTPGTTNTHRSISNRSTIAGAPALVVASPYRVERSNGDEHILQDITAISQQVLADIALRMCTWEDDGFVWRAGRLKRIQRQLFRGVLATDTFREVEAEPTAAAYEEVRNNMMQHPGRALAALRTTKKRLESLQRRTAEALPVLTSDDTEELLAEAIQTAKLDANYADYLLGELVLQRGATLEARVSTEKQAAILAAAPDEVEYNGHACKLRYKNGGKPVYHAHDSAFIMRLPEDWSLPDGRPIRIVYERKEYASVAALKQRLDRGEA